MRNARGPCASSASDSVVKLPSDFAIFSPPTCTIPRVHPVTRRTRGPRPRPGRARSRGAGTRGRRRRRGGRTPRRAGRATSPSTRCASPGAPDPTASPTPAHPASPPSRARSRPGCASASSTSTRAPADSSSCSMRAVRELAVAGERRDVEVHALPVDHVRVARVDQLGDRAPASDAMYSVACGTWSGRRTPSAIELLPVHGLEPGRDLGLGASRSSAARRMILSSTSVTLLTNVTSKPRQLEVAADHVERHRGAAVADVRGRRRRSARTRTSTPGRDRGARSRPCRAPGCRRAGRAPSAGYRAGLQAGTFRTTVASALEQRDGPRGDALGPPDRARGPRPAWASPTPGPGVGRVAHGSERGEPIGRGIAARCGARRGCLGRDHDVDVADRDQPSAASRVAISSRKPIDDAPRVLVVRRREQRAEIGEPGGTEERVGHRVGHRRRRRSARPARARRGSRTPPRTSGRPVGEGVDVEPEADPHRHRVTVPRPSTRARRAARSARRR